MPGIIDTAFVRVVPEFGGFAGQVRAGITQSFAPVRGVVAGQMAGVESRVAQTGARTRGIFGTMAAGIGRQFGAVGKVVSGAFASMTGIRLGGGTAIAAVVLGIGAAAAKMAGNWQAAVVRLQTGAGEAGSALKSVSSGMLAIARDTGTSTKQVADGMYLVESAGFHGKQGLAIMRAAAQGAKVDMADAGVVANALTTAMTDLGKNAAPPATVMSQLVAIVGHGKTTMDQLAGSLHSVLPNATALHLGIGEVGGALATMTAQGISADQAAQNLNHTIVSLANPTAQQTKTMAAFGLNASVVARDLGKRGLSGTLSELTDAIGRHMGPAGLTLTNAFNTSQIAAGKANTAYQAMSPALQKVADAIRSGVTPVKAIAQAHNGLTLAQRAQIQQWARLQKSASGFSDILKSGSPSAMTYTAALARMTGGQTGLQVALHLTGQNMPTYLANILAINKAHAEGGGNVEGWAVKQATFNQKMSELKQVVITAFIAVGTQLLPVLTKFAGFLLDTVVPALGQFGSWFSANVLPGLRALVAQFNANVMPVLRSFAGFIRSDVLPVIATVGGFLLTHLVPALQTLFSWIGGGITALRSFAEMLGRNTTPLMAIGAAITVFVLPSIISLAVAAATSAAATAVSIGETIALWALYGADAVINAAKVVGAFVMTNVAGLRAAAGAAIGFVLMIANWIRLGVVATASAIRVAAAWLIALGPIGIVIAAVVGIVALIVLNWNRVKAITAAVWSAVSGFVRDHWRLIVVILTGGLGALVIFIIDHWNAIKNGAIAVWNAIVGFFRGVWTTLRDIFNTAVNTVRVIVTGVWNTISAITHAIWGGISAFFLTIWNTIRGVFNAAIAFVRALITREWNGIKAITSAVWNAISAFFTNVWNVIRGIFNAAIAFVRALLTREWNGIKNITSTIWNGIRDFLTIIWNTIKNVIGNAIHVLADILSGGWNTIKNTATAVWNGLWSALKGLWDTAIGWIRGIPGAIKAVFSGALSWLVQVGKDIIQGLWNGLTFIWDKVTHWISSIVGWIRDHKGPISADAKLLYPAGKAIMQGLYDGLKVGSTGALGFVQNLSGVLWDQIMNDPSGAKAALYAQGKLIGDARMAALNYAQIQQRLAMSPSGQGGAGGPATAGGSLSSWIQTALAITGTPMTWFQPILRRIMYESGGNPSATNLWDINAQEGHPSVGLMQTIPSTFLGNHQPGTSYNIMDPVANIAAAINYIKRDYGSIFVIDPPTSGYAKGSWEIPRTGLAMLHQSEMVIPPRPAEAFRRAAEAASGAQLDERVIAQAVANGVAAALGGIAIRFDADGLARLVSSRQALTAARGVRR